MQDEQYRRSGLLTPSEIIDVRKRAGFTQQAMAEFLGVGEKTYTRWESGRSIHNRSSDNLIRLADKHPMLFVELDMERRPERQKVIAQYFQEIRSQKKRDVAAMAAHGELGDSSDIVFQRMRVMIARKGKGRK